MGEDHAACEKNCIVDRMSTIVDMSFFLSFVCNEEIERDIKSESIECRPDRFNIFLTSENVILSRIL